MTFGEWLTATMSAHGMTNVELARRSGVHNTVVGRWRKDTSSPSINNLIAVARIFDVPPVRLMLTLGMLTDDEAGGVGPLPLPDPTPDPTFEMIMGDPGLSKRDKSEIWSQILRRRSRRAPGPE